MKSAIEKISQDASHKTANMALLCAVMVVAIHVLKRPQTVGTLAWWVRQATGEGICRIAVPFFFAAAGYFLAGHFGEEKWWRREISKRIRSLIVPFYTWSAICFGLCSCLIIAGNMCAGRECHSGVLSCERILSVLGLNPCKVPELRQLWFLRTLFVMVGISPLLHFAIDKLKKVAGGGVFAYLWVIWAMGKFVLPRFVPHDVSMSVNFGFFSFEGMAFFMAGMILRIEGIDIFKIDTKMGCALLAEGGVMLVARWPICCAIPLLLAGVWLIIPNRPLPKCLQGVHFPLYLVHLNVVFVYFAFLHSAFARRYSALLDPGISVIGECVCFMCVLSVSMAMCIILKRLTSSYPLLGMILFGGRK